MTEMAIMVAISRKIFLKSESLGIGEDDKGAGLVVEEFCISSSISGEDGGVERIGLLSI